MPPRTTYRTVMFLAILTLITMPVTAQVDSEGDVQIFQDDILGMTSEAYDVFGDALAVGDFDGDGWDDLAIGAFGQTVSGHNKAGQVVILYGFRPDGWERRTLLDQDMPGVTDQAEAFDYFGTELAAGDFNDDGIDDLAVAASLEDFPGFDSAGAVHIFYGEEVFGLSGSHEDMITIDIAAGDMLDTTSFGEAMTVGDFDGDGVDDLAIGSSEVTIQGGYEAGAVTVVYGGPGGLSAAGAQWFTQWYLGAVNGVDDSEAGDRFGTALGAGDFNGDGHDDLVVGADGEDVGGMDRAGAVHVIYGSAGGLTPVGNLFITHEVEAGAGLGSAVIGLDLDGDGYDEMVAGASRASCSDGDLCGKIYVSAGAQSGLNTGFLTLGVDNALFAKRAGDRFGSRLTAGDFNGDGLGDLAVSAPYKEFQGADGAGTVSVLYGETALEDIHGVTFSQNYFGVEDVAEPNDQFGSALAVGRFGGLHDDLVVGADGEDVGAVTNAGAVHVLFSGFEIFSDDFESGGFGSWSVVVD